MPFHGNLFVSEGLLYDTTVFTDTDNMKPTFAGFAALILAALCISTEALAQPLTHAPWSLIIYRPENTEAMNDVRCWLTIQDAQTGEDVTYTKATARYEWVSETIPVYAKTRKSFANLFKPDRHTTLYNYQRRYYLNGGMAMHLNLKPGNYTISVTTPKEETYPVICENQDDWKSNTFNYNTQNPTCVIFVSPTADDDGFYNGGWYIDYKAPQFYRFTKPKR